MPETTIRCTDSLVLWADRLSPGQFAVLVALWISQDDPYAAEPIVKLSQREVAALAKVRHGTAQKYLRTLGRIGALTRVRRHPRGRVQGYQLHHHPEARPIVRPGVRREPVERDDVKRSARKPKPKLDPPPGVTRKQIGAVLETIPGVRRGLPYSGPAGWQVEDAIAVMAEAGWSLDDLAAACRAYCDDSREDKPTAEKLFSGAKRRREASERYGPSRPGLVEPAPLEPTDVELPPELLALYGEDQS